MSLQRSPIGSRLIQYAPYTRGWVIPGWFCSRCWYIRAPCTRERTLPLYHRPRYAEICSVYTEVSSLRRNCQNMYHFWPILTKKRYPQKCISKKMIHTGSAIRIWDGIDNSSAAEIFEEFSIRPVYTGMNRGKMLWNLVFINPPRIHGDEPYFWSLLGLIRMPRMYGDAPIETQGWQLIAVFSIYMGNQL